MGFCNLKYLFWLMALSLLSAQSFAQTVTYYQTGEEFVGPFASWKNVKTDYGAKGDGSTNDAAAINTALTAFKNTQTNTFLVLYFPAGTYVINSTIANSGRTLGDDYAGMAVVGEDPATTVISWNGAQDGAMFIFSGWQNKISRFTFDGKGVAKNAVVRNSGFGTNTEFSDLVFKGVKYGIQLAGFDSDESGQAECYFNRCKFTGCDVGIYGPNMNSLDFWVWYCLFEDCGYGVHVGGYQAYENVFLRSKVADFGLSWQPYAIVNNTSIGSKTFLKSMGGPVLLQGNKVYNCDTTLISSPDGPYDTLMALNANASNCVMLDNVFKANPALVGHGGALIKAGNMLLSAGNTYSMNWPIQPAFNGRCRAQGAAYVTGCPISKAIDNDPATEARMDMFPAGVTWNCPAGIRKVVVKYTITSTTGYASSPKNFQFLGSNDWGNNWTVLDQQTNQTWTSRQKKEFAISNSTAFTMYQIKVTANVSTNGSLLSGVSEVEFLDAQNVDITEDRAGLVTAPAETWGNYTSISDKVVDPSTLPVPTTLELPGTPLKVNRTIIEVAKGTGDDAAEIQKRILSACSTSTYGARAVVHIPKGNWAIKRTILVPARREITIIGDGIGIGGTSLLASENGVTASTFRLMGPNRATLRDINIEGKEALLVEVSDYPGSRVLGNLFYPQGYDAGRLADYACRIDSIENADLMFSGFGAMDFLSGVLVKGGPVLGSGGTSQGQIALLSGGSCAGQNYLDVQNKGKLIAQGFWYEADLNPRLKPVLDLTATSSGNIALGAMFWCSDPPDATMGIASINGFNGTVTGLSNTYQRYNKPPLFWAISGDGTNSRVLDAGSGSYSETTNWQDMWKDQSSPAANSARIGNVNVANKVGGALPDTLSILASLANMRSLHMVKPVPILDTALTDVHLIRVNASCKSGGIAAHFVAKGRGVGILTNSYNGSIYQSAMTIQKSIGIGTAIRILPNTAKIELYDMMGRMLFSKAIGQKSDLMSAESKIQELSKNRMVILRTSFTQEK